MHRAINITLDFSILAAIPMEGYYWKVKETFMFGEKREELMCNYMEGVVRMLRPNKRSKKI